MFYCPGPKISMEFILESAPPQFDIGIDGMPYAVFGCSSYTYEYAELIHIDNVVGCIAHFDGYENAVLLQPTIGM